MKPSDSNITLAVPFCFYTYLLSDGIAKFPFSKLSFMLFLPYRLNAIPFRLCFLDLLGRGRLSPGGGGCNNNTTDL